MPRKPLVYAPPGSPEADAIHVATNTNADNMPFGLTGGEYHAGMENLMSDTPAVSPNGTPVLPTKIVPWLAVLVVVAGAVIGLPEVGIAVPGLLIGAAKVITVVGSALGIVSAGQRK